MCFFSRYAESGAYLVLWVNIIGSTRFLFLSSCEDTLSFLYLLFSFSLLNFFFFQIIIIIIISPIISSYMELTLGMNVLYNADNLNLYFMASSILVLIIKQLDRVII